MTLQCLLVRVSKDLSVTGASSARKYFEAVSGGKISFTGDVFGPYRMPLKMTEYAHETSDLGNVKPSAQTLALHAAQSADRDVNFRMTTIPRKALW